MAMDYRAALLNQLDPEQAQKRAVPGAPGPDLSGPLAGPSIPAISQGEPGGFSGAGDIGGMETQPQGGGDPFGGIMDAGAKLAGGQAKPQGGDAFGGIADAAAQIGQQVAPDAAAAKAQDFSKPQLNENGYSTAVEGRPFLLGFEASKLYDPNSGSAPGSKYTSDAKAFGQAYLGGVPISRGNLGPMAAAMGHGAVPVGDDKIDPDGDGPQAPVDVIGSDGSIRYQNTTDNAQWEQAHGGAASGGGGGGGGAASGGGSPSSLNGMLRGNPYSSIQSALNSYAGPSDYLQSLLAALGGA